jgi:hypothetical protein
MLTVCWLSHQIVGVQSSVRLILVKNHIYSSIYEAARESESSSDSVVDFVTVRWTVDFQSIISPSNLKA